MDRSTFIALIATFCAASLCCMAAAYGLRKNRRCRRLMHAVLASPGVWTLQDVTVLGQCLLASLSLYNLIPRGATCQSYSAFWHFGHNQSRALVTYPYASDVQAQCGPVVPGLEASRYTLLAIIIISQFAFAAAIILRATGKCREHRTIVFFAVASASLILACAKIAVTVFIALRVGVYNIEVVCDGTELHTCSDRLLEYNISALKYPDCRSAEGGSCLATFKCSDMCGVDHLDVEVYLLMFNFLLSFFYVSYLLVEYHAGRAHLSIHEEAVGIVESPDEAIDVTDEKKQAALQNLRIVKAKRVYYRWVRNISALAKLGMALVSIGLICYHREGLTSCRDYVCEHTESGVPFTTLSSDVEDQCSIASPSASAQGVHQYIYSVAAVLCLALFVLGNQLSTKAHFAQVNQSVITFTALAELFTIGLVLVEILFITSLRLSFEDTVSDTQLHVHTTQVRGLTYEKSFQPQGCPPASCTEQCESQIPSSLTYLVGIVLISFGFTLINLVEYRELAELKITRKNMSDLDVTDLDLEKPLNE